MIRKYEVLEKIGHSGVVGIVRVDDAEYGIMAAEAIFEGGIPVIEVSMTYRGAHEIMAEMTRRLGPKGLVLGAGTVSDPQTANACMLAGAEFIFAHCFNPEVARICNRRGIPYIPGVGTVTEVMAALESGADVLKAFPGEVLGPAFIKALRGPLPDAKIVAVGGVSDANLKEWFDAGAFGVGLGSALTKPSGYAASYEAICAASREAVRKIALIRNGKR